MDLSGKLREGYSAYSKLLGAYSEITQLYSELLHVFEGRVRVHT